MEEFDEWPYGSTAMIYCHTGYEKYKTGCFSNYELGAFGLLNTDNWTQVCTKQEFEEAKAKMKETKHYWNGKEELEVGMWVLHHGIETEILLPADVDGDYVIANKGEYVFECIDCFEPIDTRTDKEKFVDDVYRSDLNVRENIALAYEKWVENKK